MTVGNWLLPLCYLLLKLKKMIKRIFKTLLLLVSFVMVLICCFTIPFTGVYALVKYIIKGEEDLDIVTCAVDWAIMFPDNCK